MRYISAMITLVKQRRTMAKTATLNLRIEPEVKAESMEVLNELGVSMSSAVSMFLRSVIRQRELPREVALPHSHGVIDATKLDDQTLIKLVESRTADNSNRRPIEELWRNFDFLNERA